MSAPQRRPFVQGFHCSRCSREDEPARNGLCAHCALAEDLAALLDDGSGAVAALLMPLFTALITQKQARSARTWLVRNPVAAQLLTEIARGTKPPDHTAFMDHPSVRKVAFLRELCVEHGLIEPFNKDIETYQAWIERKLVDAPAGIAAMIRLYGRWSHLNRMHRLTRIHQTHQGTLLSAKQSTTVAMEFLEFLAGRNVSPGACRQQDIDDWLSSGPTTRALARSFVRWAHSESRIRN